MKIAVLGSRGYPSTYGGFETFVRRLVPYLVTKGHDVTAYGRLGVGLPRTTWRDGARCVDTPGLDSKSLSTLTHGATGSLHASVRRADAALVVNVAHGYFLPMLRSRGVPTALNVDGLEWKRDKWGPAARSVFRGAARMSARHADVLVADARAIAAHWETEFQRRPVFIPYGADVVQDAPDDLVRGMGLEPGSYALVVARLAPENNVELIVDAIAAAGPAITGAVVVGSANYESPLTAKLTALSAQDGFRWLGHVSDQDLLAQLWAHAGVYLHGHSAGGTNPALLQAMGYGARILALDTEFNREVLGPVPEGLFAPDVEQLSARIVEALAGRDGMAGSDAQQVVADRYRWDAVFRAYELLLGCLADRARVPADPYVPGEAVVPAGGTVGG